MSVEKKAGDYPGAREVLSLEVDEGFVPKVLGIDGDLLSKTVTNLGYDLGAVGDDLSNNKFYERLGVVIDPVAEVWLVEKSNLVSSILTNGQAEVLGITLEKRNRLGVLENTELKKRIFFIIPEMDVAQFFPKSVSSSESLETTLKNIDDNKGKIFGEFLMNGDEYLALGRQIYGVWNRAVQTGEFGALDKMMDELYPNVIPEKNYDTTEALATLVGTDLMQEEAEYPAKNWWKSRAVVNKVMDLVRARDLYDRDFKKVVEIINLISDRTSFYPDQLWTVVVKPLMELYREKGKYESQSFVRQVVGNDESLTSPHLLLSLPEVRKIYDGID